MDFADLLNVFWVVLGGGGLRELWMLRGEIRGLRTEMVEQTKKFQEQLEAHDNRLSAMEEEFPWRSS